jgi:SM-20-related protein
MYEMLYSKITDDLVKNGFIIVEQALSMDLNKKLFSLCQDEAGFKKAKISAANNVHLDRKKRSDSIRWLDEDMYAQSEFLAFAKGLQNYLNRHLYLGLNYYESHFAVYKEGDFYEKHLDTFKNFKNRVVTTVYYLNEEWVYGDGGELLVYDVENKLILSVEPKSGTLVVFLSEKFPHEVLPAKKNRYSIAGWFRVDKIGA